jgi:hypothetical protein
MGGDAAAECAGLTAIGAAWSGEDSMLSPLGGSTGRSWLWCADGKEPRWSVVDAVATASIWMRMGRREMIRVRVIYMWLD